MAIFWDDDHETSEHRKERKKKLKEVSPYSLVIRTDSYTGNFERELIAFVFGILDEVQSENGYASNYIKAFWNCVSRMEFNTYEEYKNGLNDDKFNLGNSSLMSMTNTGDGDVDNILNNIKSIIGCNSKTDEYKDLYNEYLCTTYRIVDDWEQDTFYYIDRYVDSNQCDCIVVQLQKPFNEKYEKLVIDRIKTFFNDNIYSVIENFDYVCLHNSVRYKEPMVFQLLSIELIDNKNNIIKTYEV